MAALQIAEQLKTALHERYRIEREIGQPPKLLPLFDSGSRFRALPVDAAH